MSSSFSSLVSPANQATRNVRIVLRASPSIASFFNAASLIPDSPSIAVPVTLNSAGLAKVVEHLLKELGLEQIEQLALLFRDVQRDLVLSSTLDRYLTREGVSEEHTLLLEYFPRPKDPKPSGSTKVPDWISGIKVAKNKKGLVYASSFDGSLIEFDASGKLVQRLATAHKDSIRALSVLTTLDNTTYLFSGSKDGSIAAWTTAPMTLAGMCGNSGIPVDAVDAAKSSDNNQEALLIGGGSDGLLKLYQMKLDVSENNGKKHSEDKERGKRQHHELACQEAVGVLSGHSDKISAVQWLGDVDPTSCYSASWDCTLRVWDVVRQVETASWRLPKAATCMSQRNNLMVSGHADYIVRVWDARVAGGDSACKTNLSSHQGWVSSVAFQSEYVIASASYDRTIKVWDVRRMAPLHTIETNLAGRLFAVDWGADSLYAGGTDAELRRYSL